MQAFTTYPEFWINTRDFDVTGLWFNGIGCAFWVIAYAAIVHTMIKKKFVEMPFFIAAGNLAWELVWSTCYFPDTGIIFAIEYQGAFLLDCFIFYYVLKYGANHIEMPELKKNLKIICILSFLSWIPINYFFVKEGYDTSIGANSGYILNIIISILYPIAMIKTVAQHYSKVVAWTKMLGTGLITVSLFFFYPKNHFVQTLGIIVLALDCLYIYLLYLFQKRVVWGVPMQLKITTITLLACVLIAIPLFGRNICIVGKKSEDKITADKIQMLETFEFDSLFDAKKLTSRKFTNYNYDSINRDNKAYWLKINVFNNSEKGVFILGTSFFDFLKIHQQDSALNFSTSPTGSSVNNNLKELISGSNSYIKTILKKGENTLYLFVLNKERKDYQYSPLPLTIYDQNSFNKLHESTSFFLHFFLGAIIIMTLYNLALYFIVRKKFYLL